MTNRVPITVAHGDGIGPEIMDATLTNLKEAGSVLEIVQTVSLNNYDGKAGFTLAQGQ